MIWIDDDRGELKASHTAIGVVTSQDASSSE